MTAVQNASAFTLDLEIGRQLRAVGATTPASAVSAADVAAALDAPVAEVLMLLSTFAAVNLVVIPVERRWPVQTSDSFYVETRPDAIRDFEHDLRQLAAWLTEFAEGCDCARVCIERTVDAAKPSRESAR